MSPDELVELLNRKIPVRGLGGSRNEPAGPIGESGHESEPRAALLRGLRDGEHLLGKEQIADGVGDVNDLQAAAGRKQSFEREAKIERGVPGGNAAGEDAAHGKGGVKAIGISLDEAGGDHAAERMAPRDGAFWRANQLVEKIEHRDLIGESF